MLSIALRQPVMRWGAGFMLQGGNGQVRLASPQRYGHLAGSGCVGWIDPVERVTVAFVSNRNAGTGSDWDEWRDRLESAVNVGLSTVGRV